LGKHKPIEPDEVIRLYVLEHLTQRESAGRLGISVYRLQAELLRLGIPLRSSQDHHYWNAEQAPEHRQRKRNASAQIEFLRSRATLPLTRIGRRKRKANASTRGRSKAQVAVMQSALP
jgi:hypothetical protein